MEFSLFKEVNKKTMDAYLDEKVWPPMYFEVFFPYDTTLYLTYETLIGANGLPVAADVVAYNSSAPLKTRKIIDKLSGEIPAIRIAKDMSEVGINTYNTLQAMINASAGEKKSRQQKIFDMVFGDIDACVTGCRARLEWICLTALCSGSVTLSKSNNAGIITEEAIDFQMPAANKRVPKTATSTRVWNNATAANPKPITDIEVIVDAMEDAGYSPKYMLMNRTNWQYMRAATEVINYVGNSSLLVNKPILPTLNEALQRDGLPQIVIINSKVTTEIQGTQTTVEPWTTKYVTFLPELKTGSTLVGPLADETNPAKQATQTKSGPILVQKYSEVNPIREVTMGMINAFPSWPAVNSCYRLDTQLYAADGLDD